METTEDADPYELVAVEQTAYIDRVIKKLEKSDIRFEIDMDDADIGRAIRSLRGTCSEGVEVSLYVHKDDIDKYRILEKTLYP